MTAEEKLQAIEKLFVMKRPMHDYWGTYPQVHAYPCFVCQIQNILGYENEEWTWTKKDLPCSHPS